MMIGCCYKHLSALLLSLQTTKVFFVMAKAQPVAIYLPDTKQWLKHTGLPRRPKGLLAMTFGQA